MTRATAVGWLFYFHAFERWNEWHAKRGKIAGFTREKPSDHY